VGWSNTEIAMPPKICIGLAEPESTPVDMTALFQNHAFMEQPAWMKQEAKEDRDHDDTLLAKQVKNGTCNDAGKKVYPLGKA
jgi:hypothetical protein